MALFLKRTNRMDGEKRSSEGGEREREEREEEKKEKAHTQRRKHNK
jgi:hypothetical protein